MKVVNQLLYKRWESGAKFVVFFEKNTSFVASRLQTSWNDNSAKKKKVKKKYWTQIESCCYWGSQSYPSFLEIIKAQAVKEENFEDFPITSYTSFKTLNMALYIDVSDCILSTITF